MSAKLGAVKYGTEHGDPFLGRSMGTQADYSHEVAREIDEEVRKLIETAHTEAWDILTENRDALDALAGELLEKETLHRAELKVVLRRRQEAAPHHRVRRLRWAHPVGPAADQDTRRARHRARRRMAAAGAGTRIQGRDPKHQRRQRRAMEPTVPMAPTVQWRSRTPQRRDSARLRCAGRLARAGLAAAGSAASSRTAAVTAGLLVSAAGGMAAAAELSGSALPVSASVSLSTAGSSGRRITARRPAQR